MSRRPPASGLPAREVHYPRVPIATTPPHQREVEDDAQLRALLAAGSPLSGLRFQGLDLTAYAGQLGRRTDLSGLVVLGGRLTPALEHHLRAHGAVVFPADPHAPVDPYRARLYTATELYDGLARSGYDGTPDGRAYAWARDAALRHDAYVTVLRAIHDDAVSDALSSVVHGRRVVGVMGGHTLSRGSPGFAAAARLGQTLAAAGVLVATGGGPGAMEAANLGAWASDVDVLETALRTVARVPHFATGIDAWAQVALDLVAAVPSRPAGTERSLGVPTWFYGHEPPNVFGDVIAKFFSNALREDLLLRHCTGGVVVLPGAAGTVQEVFQLATRSYYEVSASIPPVVLVGVEHWTTRLPVWPLLQALGRDRPMGEHLHLVEDVEQAAALLTGPRPPGPDDQLVAAS